MRQTLTRTHGNIPLKVSSANKSCNIFKALKKAAADSALYTGRFCCAAADLALDRAANCDCSFAMALSWKFFKRYTNEEV